MSSPQDIQVVVEGLAQRTHLEARPRAGEVAFAKVRLAEGKVDEDAAWFAQDPAGRQHSQSSHVLL